ncbi:MAG: peptide chain release factor N(5)-glutamine methyltransferase [Candidatus Melainabacteria bacterium]|nr:peptide chain release factor N(5)-glutamine methyltransferase [Candidatus Melainabacteria bacterium]MBI3309675.1 peptide chain release factor N(5)-glutamine methyltransferase [Candidatus Melainabacteria bacterium]
MSEINYSDLLSKLISAGIEASEAKREISILKAETKSQVEIEKIIKERIETRKPIQHLLGKAYFMDFEVKVNEQVLIPRPETEILVEEAVKRLQTTDNRPVTSDQCPMSYLSALDIGTGSGIIPIALCKMIPNIKVTAIDINNEIIELAKENAKLSNTNEHITFQTCDVFSDDFEKLLKENKFSLIISNPPYIADTNPPKQPELKYEPKLALHGSKENKSGFIYYERIIKACNKNYGTALPLIALEIDPPLTDKIKQLLKIHNIKNYQIIKDYNKLDRCLII